MTQKELLYVEDAIEHEKIIISILEASIDKIENEDLETFLSSELKKHETLKKKLMQKLEDESCE